MASASSSSKGEFHVGGKYRLVSVTRFDHIQQSQPGIMGSIL
jgi:hypothetical protein